MHKKPYLLVTMTMGLLLSAPLLFGVRDELLNTNWFEDLDDARRCVQAWRRDYNDVRPHSSLGDETPSAFASQFRLLEAETAKRDP